MQLTKTTMIMAAAMLGMAGVAAAQGLSEPQARATLLAACNNVSALSRDRGGNWHAYCSKGPMMVDATGKVTADKGDNPGSMSEGQARATLMASCNNVSELSTDGNDNWTGACSKGSFAIDPSGKLAFK